MATLKEIFEGNTSKVLEATELLKVLGDREGQFVWKQLTAEGGDFIAFVTADNENSYPNGGTQDGYWYELVEEGITLDSIGITRYAVDTFTFASNTPANGTQISHSLGEIPKLAIVVSEFTTTEKGFYFAGGVYNYLQASSASGSRFVNPYAADKIQGFSQTWRLSDTYVITEVEDYQNYKAGVKYTLMTFV